MTSNELKVWVFVRIKIIVDSKDRVIAVKKLLLLLAFSSPVLSDTISSRIANGSDVSGTRLANDFSSFGSLFKDNGVTYSGPYCGATFINDQWVMTAAHCFYGNDNTMLYMRVAYQLRDKSNYVSSTISKPRALEFYYPDDYIDSESFGLPNDIALIKLETSASGASDHSSLFDLSAVGIALPLDGNYIAIGHGNTEATKTTNILQETSLTKTNTADCNNAFKPNVTGNQLCFAGALSGAYRNAACLGDSGGPVYRNNGGSFIQVGVTSFGPEGACGVTSGTDITSVYTKIHAYKSWIDSVMAGSVTPKAYVKTVNGQRQLVKNTPATSDDGGSLGFIPLLLSLLLISYRRFTCGTRKLI